MIGVTLVTLRNPMKSTFATIACIIFGPFIVWQNFSDIFTAVAAKSWPSTEGTITSSKILMSKGRTMFTTYAPVLKYSYEVGGKSYSGHRIDYGDASRIDSKDAMAVGLHYHEGAAVKVHYNPKSPVVAVLEPGTTRDNWVLLGLGIVITGVGVFAGCGMWRRFQSERIAPSSGF
jgi:Protein of unknown function (DUF3592)